MTSKKASLVLGPAVNMNPGSSMSTFTVLPFQPPTAGPTYWIPREQHRTPLMTPSQPVVLPAFRGTPLVAGDASHGPTGTRAGNIVVQTRSEVGRAEPPKTQTLVLTQAPLSWTAPGTLYGGAASLKPQFLAAAAVQTVIHAPAVGGTQTVQGGWSPGLPPQAPPRAVQLAPVVPPVNAGPCPNGASRDGGMDTSQSLASLYDSCNPTSVYENFQRWQHFKALAWSHLPQSPDAEALSCFLIPVLRTLSHRKPTMTLEKGLKWAMREWQQTSNFDQMIFYEMAEKFMEFENEDMQIQNLHWMKGAQGLPPHDPPKHDPSELPAPMVGSQPACISRKAIPRAQPASMHRYRPPKPREIKAPKEIPPEAVREYMDIMDELVGLAPINMGEPGGEFKEDRKKPQQEDNGTYPDLGLLNYIDELCSQEDFITKVEAVIHPQFLEHLLSEEQQLDPLALAEELEQEEELTLAQLVEKRLLTLKEKKSVQAPPSHGAPQLDSHPSESEASKDTRRHDHGPQLGFSDKACPPEADVNVPQRHCQADVHRSRSKALDVSSGCQESPPLWDQWSPSSPEGHRRTSSGLGPRDASIPREISPVRETPRPENWCSEDEEVLPSLSFLWDSQNNLLPWRFTPSPVRASGLVVPGGRGDRGAPPSLTYQRIDLSRVDPSPVESRKRALGGGPSPAEKIPRLGADRGVPERPSLVLGSVHSSQSQKTKCDPFDTGKRRKMH